ncbi:MAG: shikimate kinase [Bacteroidales bacterium]|nr:shikimate kinase [Bacteroidales bacterium]
MRIFIVGFMGSGKSSVGRKLAHKLGYDFLDTDVLFENRFQMSIPNFFTRFGEQKFRELEHEVLLSHIEMGNMVLSTGGGTPCFYNHMKLLKQYGTVIYLKMEAGELFERLKHSRRQRPLINKENTHDLYQFIEVKLEERRPFYEQAHIEVDAAHINTRTLVEIVNHYEKTGKK